MTFSIAAYDSPSQSWGVAVASKCLAVGHAVPWGGAGRGAIATQALANLSYGEDGLTLLDQGLAAQEVVARLVGADVQASHRQLAVVDSMGRAANWTGPDCLPWAGGRVDAEVSVQGNILAGEEVLTAMVAGYREDPGASFAARLLHALELGEAAGGDRRGKQSSAMRVWREGAAYGGGLDIAIDLRVDEHAEPVRELGRLVGLHDLYFCRPEPGSLIALDQDLREEVENSLVVLGYLPDERGGFDAAFDRWVGTENFEERHVPGSIDPRVLSHLRTQVASAR